MFWKKPATGPDRSAVKELVAGSRRRGFVGGILSQQERQTVAPEKRIVAVAMQGAGGGEEARMIDLLSHFPIEVFPFNRKTKLRCFRDLLRTILRIRPELVVMEGTGVAGGMALLTARLIAGIPYVVSSGDAVGPYVAGRRPVFGPLFHLYERILCRLSAGFIGWTPYLTGRALTFGAPRAMTAPGWAPFPLSIESQLRARAKVRSELGIAPNDLVFGIMGSLAWTKKVGYCYGLELVRALSRTRRPDLKVLIVGEGAGRIHLQRAAGKALGNRVILTGQARRERVPEYLAAMDVASLPQSVDQVGSFRYTTKISEYLGARLPIVTGQIPLAYDFGDDWLWRLPGDTPWGERYLDALAQFMDGASISEVSAKRDAIPREIPAFDRNKQIGRATSFVSDLLNDHNGNASVKNRL
jgi:glycosyltransferase involved in cell wall biosynthesis